MTEHVEGEEHKPAARGEAAWKETKERIAASNQKAKKAGKERREVYEQGRANALRAAEARRDAKLIGKRQRRVP
jgi:hypothetical protein